MAVMSRRYWYRRGGSYRVDSSGFLIDPEGTFRDQIDADLVRLSDLDGQECLVLLGEPAMGKSTELEFERSWRDRENDSSSEAVVRRDLGGYGEEMRLIHELFKTPEWDSWRAGRGSIRLELDTLDECRIYIPKAAAVILEQLEQLPRLDRLKLRVVCRTGAWPHLLEEGLRELRPGGRTGVFELAPLRRRDVEEIALGMGIEGVEAFVQEVENRDAGPLAAKPITLKLLANIYKRSRQLPRTQSDLYEQGCRVLCEEFNESRLSSGQHGKLGLDRRLAVAARIASATVICGRPAILDGPDLGDRPEGVITVSELGGIESDSGVDFLVTEENVREVLSDTGLFSARGPRLMGWSHRTFAEYPSARYLFSHDLGIEQVKDLIMHPNIQGKVVPQLLVSAAWLAGMVPEVFRTIMSSDPGVLLRSDVENVSINYRHALVESLFEAAGKGLLLDVGFKARSEYRKLDHPGLAAQLEPFIFDKGENSVVRRMAIDIAHECQTRGFQGRMVDLVLDRSDDLELRVTAAYAICSFADEPTRGRMRLLLDTDLEEDTHDDLRGCALHALWPDLISAEAMFQYLLVPKISIYVGSYQSFLIRYLIPGLTAEDLPAALRWVASHGDLRRLPYNVRSILNEIMIRAGRGPKGGDR